MDIKIGQEVWFSMPYIPVNVGTVNKIIHDELAVVLKTESGHQKKSIKDCYPSEKELRKAIEAENKAAVAKHEAGIQTVEDLVRFMYDNVVATGAEEYTDYNARQAVRNRAEELLNIKLGE